MIKGSCMCAGVQYEIHGELGDITHCHCPTCRKAHASAFSSVAPVDADKLVITKGEELIRYYESSPGKRRYFCSNCGSHLYSKREDQDHCLIRLGCIDDDPGSRSAQHIFMRYQAPWYDLHESLPEFYEWPSESEPPASEPAPELAGFLEEMQALLTIASRKATATSLLLIELADTVGETDDDAVLGEILNNIRNSDSVASLGGNEFAVLLPYTGANASMVLAERIRNTMRHLHPETDIAIGAATLEADRIDRDNLQAGIDAVLRMAESAIRHVMAASPRTPTHFNSLKRA